MSRKRPHTSISIERAYAQIHGPNLSATRAAEQLGVTPRTITRIRARLGLSQPHPAAIRRVTTEEIARIDARLEEGWSIREIERTEHTTWRTIHRHVPGKGWTRSQAGSHARLLGRFK